MSSDPTEKAECRGCHRELRGAPYYTGGAAYDPVTGKRMLAHYFGGWVCSARCEIRVFDVMKAENVWGSTESRIRSEAYKRHGE